MKKSILLSAILLLSLHLFAEDTVLADSTQNKTQFHTITIDPGIRNQVLEGWGGSLCWWANIMGGYSPEKIKTICDWITNPVDGLNMNIFRFNIGGGDAPTHHHMRTDGGAMPGYKDSPVAPYNWTRDANQRRILQQLIASRIANTGVDDVKIVGFSNSPPWWMTVSGCVAGSTDGKTTNLKPNMFDDFADYLTDVTKYYHDSFGITFDHLEPFNEPFSTWWTANKKGGQEGCCFTQNDQHKMIRKLYAKLVQKNMLSYCTISAMDANSLDEAYAGVQGYKTAGDILPKLSRLDVHSYAGNQRAQLNDFAIENNIGLWQSESGPLSIGGSNEHQMMVVADRIITDLRDMKCSAWVDWQIANDKSPIWGLLIGSYRNSANPVVKGPSFYLRAQYSRYLKVGYTVINSSLPTSIAAISPDKKELVIVISNKKTDSQQYKIDLSLFKKIETIKQIRTSLFPTSLENNVTTSYAISDNVFSYKALPQSVTTFVVQVGK